MGLSSSSPNPQNVEIYFVVVRESIPFLSIVPFTAMLFFAPIAPISMNHPQSDVGVFIYSEDLT
jgi:hypothetical protein